MDDDRLGRIEAALLRLTEATEAGFAASTALSRTLAEMIKVLDARMGVLEAQMTEVLGRLRIIGEQVATHTHPDRRP